MKDINKFLKLFFFFSIIPTGLCIAQTYLGYATWQGYNPVFTAPPSNIFYPTIPTTGNGSSSADAQSISATDEADIRIFPSIHQQSEPHISIDQTNKNNIIVSANTYTTTWQQGYYGTNDGCLNWFGNESFPGSSSAGVGGDPSTAFDADGNVFMSTMNNVNTDYLMTRSNDKGLNWTVPVNGNASSIIFDKEMIAADNMPNSPNANNLYCVWTELFTGGIIKFNRSTDGGANFSTPIPLSNNAGQGANVQTGPNGEVYVCWADYPAGLPASGIGFAKSMTDGGVSFTTASVIFPYTGIRLSNGPDALFNGIKVNDFPSMAIDKSCGQYRGRIYITYAAQNTLGDSRVQVRYSSDQGNTWSSANTINISIGRQNWFPWIAVDNSTGTVCVVYFSIDQPSGFSTNTYLAYSSDGGVSFNNVQVSDVSHTTSPIPGTFALGYEGDYIGVTAYGGKAYAAWMDDRYTTWQVFVSPVTFDAPIYYSSSINIDVNGPVSIASGQNVLYEASNNITAAANNTTMDVLSGANAVMRAGNEIILQDGFTAQSGSDFHAYIATVSGCTNTYNRLETNNQNKNINYQDELIFSLYPNPTNSTFTLQMETEDDASKNISVFTTIGKEIFHLEKITAASTIIDLSSNPKGIYFVKVIQDGKMAVKKIVYM